jgi:hypothetical protein
LFGSLRRIEFDDTDVPSTDRQGHPLPLRGVAQVFISLRRDARQFVSDLVGPVGTLAVPLRQLFTSDRSLDDELSRLFVDDDVVSSLESESFPEFLGDRYLASFPDLPAFARIRTYSYRIHTDKPPDGRRPTRSLRERIELDETGIVDTSLLLPARSVGTGPS